MILTINIENTNTVIGCIEDKQFLFVESLSTSVMGTEIEYAIRIKSIFEFYQLDVAKVKGSIISSVVPQITSVMQGAIKRLVATNMEQETLVIGPGVKTGLNIMVDNPAQVGSDLVANAVAGIAKYEAPMLIVDMGTATTISVINEKKQYIGGMIIPGIRVASASLSNEAAQLPKVGIGKPKRVIGTNTIDCMKSGLVYGTASMIDGAIRRIEKEFGKPIKTIVATGENIKHILPHCERKMCLDETLLLDGLRIIYERNVKSH